ncbi:MAG: hypothetical protein K2H96_09100 [Muribaculaceae bacterium]|nr:hypothetical protein [Muribaculaceae bacterium]
MKRYIIAVTSLLTVIPASAQFDQSISVEGKYIPEVIRLDRINAFPRQEKFSLETTPLSYDAKGITASFIPGLYTMPALGWRDTRKVADNRGYLELGAGSWLNSTLSAGYRFIQTDKSVMGVRFQHNSTSLWKPKLSEITADTRQWRYNETIGIYGSYKFEGTGRLDAAIDCHIGNFNYYGFNPVWLPGGFSSSEIPSAPTQTLNDLSARVGWQSPSVSDNISWNASLGARYFGYRRMYDISDMRVNGPTAVEVASLKSTRETNLYLNAGVLFPTSSKSSLGIDLDAELVAYSGYKDNETLASPLFHPAKPDTYGMFTLTPYYRFSIDRLNFRLGVDVDIAAGAGKKGDRYDLFHFAPDVAVDFDGGPARLYLHLAGGSRLHTLASGAELDYYQQPFILNTAPVYSPLDGEFGASFGPFSGFSAGIGLAFKVLRGEYLGGWYQQLLNYGRFAYGADLPEGMMQSIGNVPLNYSFLEDDTYNLHGYSLRANINYDFGSIFKISASGSYQPQKGTTGYFNGLDRPRWVAGIEAQTNPWTPLKLTLAYNYRGVRNAYIYGTYHNDKGFNETVLTAYRLPDVTSLDFGASYSFSDKFSLWLQADNLLNRKIEILPGTPSQGINFAGGLSVLF